MKINTPAWRYAIAAVACTAIAACTSSTTGAGPAASPPAVADAARIWADFVACARMHGQPAWPDAAVDANTGQATFAGDAGFDAKSAFEAVRRDCGHVLDVLPPAANPLARPVVSASEIAAKLRYSQCMREHGVPEWRDPVADGYYDDQGIPGYNTDPDVFNRVQAAAAICDPIIGRSR